MFPKFLSQLLHPVLRLLAILIVALSTLLLAPSGHNGEAQATERVYVLSAGGVDELQRVTIRYPVEATPNLSIFAPFPLTLWQDTAATYTDLVALPGGNLLLAGGSGRGAVLFDATGEQVDQLFSPGEMNAPTSLVAGGYIDPNFADRLLLGDNTVGRAQIYDWIDGRYLFSQSFQREGLRAQIRRAILLPENRIAAAISWPAMALSAVEIVSISPSSQEFLALYSQAVEDRPQAVIIEGLHPLRDLMADIDGRLLITSADRVLIVDAGGALLWQAVIGDYPELAGEFQSARWLESGLVVAATRQPGYWIEPHRNHRIHLFDPQGDPALLDSTTSLNSAPLRLEPTVSSGGTGTRDYFADAFDFGGPPLSVIEVGDGPTLAPGQIPRDSSAFFDALLINNGEESIWLRRVEFRVAPGPCENLEIPDDLTTPWFSLRDRQIGAGQQSAVDTVVFPDHFSLGPWCGQLAITSRDGDTLFVGSPLGFEVFPPQTGQDKPVRVDDLESFDGADAGGDDTGTVATPDDPDAQGCACSTSPSTPPLWFVLILVAMLAWKMPAWKMPAWKMPAWK